MGRYHRRHTYLAALDSECFAVKLANDRIAIDLCGAGVSSCPRHEGVALPHAKMEHASWIWVIVIALTLLVLGLVDSCAGAARPSETVPDFPILLD